VNDLGKVAVIAGIMGAILLAGILMAPVKQQEEAALPEPAPAEEVTVLQEDTLEMLDPIYSEKAVFQDGMLRIAFDASYTDEGLQSRLPFWLHNISGDVINILWDRCSLQLPGGNTVKVLSEESLTHFGTPGSTITIAPSGDLFDAIIPVSEFTWAAESSWSVSTGVLDAGTFTLVLAVEHGDARPSVCPTQAPRPVSSDPCKEDLAPRMGKMTSCCEGRTINYYTFRFVVR